MVTWGSCCCFSVAKSRPSLWDPMDRSTPGFPVLYYLPELAQAHIHRWWYHPTNSSSVTPFSSCPQSFPALGFFPTSWLFPSCGQSIGASASASVFPMNIQGWFPLWLTGLTSLQSKGLSRVFTVEPQFKRHQLFGAHPSLPAAFLYHPILTLIHRPRLTNLKPKIKDLLIQLSHWDVLDSIVCSCAFKGHMAEK